MQRKVAVVEDLEGNKIVVMHDIIFKGKRSVEWADVETYLKRFVGEEYNIEATDFGKRTFLIISNLRNIL